MPAPVASLNLTCSYQTALRSENCNGSAAVGNGGICGATDSTGLQQRRVYCDSCLAPTGPSSRKKLVLVIVLPLGILAVVLLVVYGLFRCYRNRYAPVAKASPINFPP